MNPDERKEYLYYISIEQAEQQRFIADAGENFYRGEKKGIEKGIKIGEEKGKEVGKKEGLAEGKDAAQKEFILKSFRKGLSVETIAEITELDEEQVRNIIQNEK
jgi:predicted transposase YdaD